MQLEEPNLTIAGNEAKVVVTRHKNEKWATTVYASGRSHIFRVEANRRLEGSELDAFVEFVERIVKGA